MKVAAPAMALGRQICDIQTLIDPAGCAMFVEAKAKETLWQT